MWVHFQLNDDYFGENKAIAIKLKKSFCSLCVHRECEALKCNLKKITGLSFHLQNIEGNLIRIKSSDLIPVIKGMSPIITGAALSSRKGDRTDFIYSNGHFINLMMGVT